MFQIFGTPIIRAINKNENKQLYFENKSIENERLKSKMPYKFTIHKGTIWCDKKGDKRWQVCLLNTSLPSSYSHIVLMTKLTGKFIENPGDPGKYYCTKTHQARVFIFTGRWSW